MKKTFLKLVLLAAICLLMSLLSVIGVYATLPTHWNMAEGADLNGVAWGNGVFVAVGTDGIIKTSGDGFNWVKRESGITCPLYGIVWGGTQFAAVGSKGTILTSKDGERWKKAASGVTVQMNSVAWNKNTFVAVGEDGVILTSSDGVTWDKSTSGNTQALKGICTSDKLFVAVGENATILKSTDGLSWTKVNSYSGKEKSYVLEKIKWSSTDGFIAVGWFGADHVLPLSMKSSDADVWQTYEIGSSGPEIVKEGRFLDVAWVEGGFTAIGDQGWLFTFPPCVCAVRAEITKVAQSDLKGIACSESQLVAVGSNGTIITSMVDEVHAFVNGDAIAFTTPPVMVNNTALAPFKNLLEALGAQVDWDGETGFITAKKGDREVVLKTDSVYASIDGKQKVLSIPPSYRNGGVYVPVRFVAESLGYEVNWDAEIQVVNINSVAPIVAKSVTSEEAKELIASGAFLIDVRTLEEYKEKHIKGSTLVPLDVIQQKISEVVQDKAGAVIVYCESGKRSKEAAEQLLKLGYSKVYDLGGITNWTYEVESN